MLKNPFIKKVQKKNKNGYWWKRTWTRTKKSAQDEVNWHKKNERVQAKYAYDKKTGKFNIYTWRNN